MTVQSHKQIIFLISAAFIISVGYFIKNYRSNTSKDTTDNKNQEKDPKNIVVDEKAKAKQREIDKEKRINPNNYQYDLEYWKELKSRLKISKDEVSAFENYIYNEEEKEFVACEYAKNVKFFYGDCDKDNEKGAEDIGLDVHGDLYKHYLLRVVLSIMHFGCCIKHIKKETHLRPGKMIKNAQNLVM